MIYNILLLISSLIILTLGAEGLVKGSSSIAIKFGITPLAIGLTVVAFGTSSPELVVSVAAAWKGQSDIAFGNVIGSNIFNIGIILGLTALICPVKVNSKVVRRDGFIMVIVAVLLIFLGGNITRSTGIAFFIGIVSYTLINIYLARQETLNIADTIPRQNESMLTDLFYIIGGLLALVIGSRLLVSSAVDIARAIQVSEAVIGLTIIAAGTSMPELATSVVAALRREADIAVGNVIGSNIFNILGILGLSSILSPIKTVSNFSFDILIMVGISILVLPLLYSKLKLERWEGVLLLVGYSIYLVLLWPK